MRFGQERYVRRHVNCAEKGCRRRTASQFTITGSAPAAAASRHSFKVLLAAPHPVLVDLDAKPRTIGHRDVTVGDAQAARRRHPRQVPGLVTVRPQAIAGTTAATCSAAAEATLDSPVLQEILTRMPSRSQRRQASNSGRKTAELDRLQADALGGLRA